MNFIYAVVSGYYSDKQTMAVFDTAEAAQDHADRHNQLRFSYEDARVVELPYYRGSEQPRLVDGGGDDWFAVQWDYQKEGHSYGGVREYDIEDMSEQERKALFDQLAYDKAVEAGIA
jgi:hypothetical protein